MLSRPATRRGYPAGRPDHPAAPPVGEQPAQRPPRPPEPRADRRARTRTTAPARGPATPLPLTPRCGGHLAARSLSPPAAQGDGTRRTYHLRRGGYGISSNNDETASGAIFADSRLQV